MHFRVDAACSEGLSNERPEGITRVLDTPVSQVYLQSCVILENLKYLEDESSKTGSIFHPLLGSVVKHD